MARVSSTKAETTPTPTPVTLLTEQIPDHAPTSVRPVALESAPNSEVRRTRLQGKPTWFFVLATILLFVIGLRSETESVRPAVKRWFASWNIHELIESLKPIHNLAMQTNAIEDLTSSLPLQPSQVIRHEGHVGLHGGILFAPDTFETADGWYDLILHFHGNTSVIRESAEVANLNAIVAIINLGIGSAPYEETYAVPGKYEELLSEIQWAVEQRGVKKPKLRRVALSSWSAGYGAISTILQVRKGIENLDAILVLDGIHCRFLEDGIVDGVRLIPFAQAAKAAADNKILFSITHSEIEPPDYAGSSATANYLLSQIKEPIVANYAPLQPPHLLIKAAEGAVSKKLEKHMEPTVQYHSGSLHVRGYKGNTPEHHMAHLLQMGATVLPELAARWKTIPTADELTTHRGMHKFRMVAKLPDE